MLRKNFDTGYGAMELNWSIPAVWRLKGYVQYSTAMASR